MGILGWRFVCVLLLCALACEAGYKAIYSDDDLDLVIDDNVDAEDSLIIVLDKSTFHEQTKGGLWFIEFHAPWCSICQHFAPHFEEFAFKERSTVHCGTVDCTVPGNEQICEKHGVQGYPTLKLLDVGQPSKVYTGERSVPAMQQYIAEYLESKGLVLRQRAKGR